MPKPRAGFAGNEGGTVATSSAQGRTVQYPLATKVYPSPVARRLLLHLFSIGHSLFPTPWQIDPFEKPGACIFWMRSGHGHLRLDNTEWELEPGPYFWFYDTAHTRVFTPAAGQTMIAQAFWFGGPGLEGWLETLDTAHQPQFRLRHPERVREAYLTMTRLVRRRPSNWEWQIHLVLSAVLGEFLQARRLLTSGKHAQPPAITQALDAVEADPARDWKASELAAAAGMSYTAFRVLFRETLGESPHAFLQRARLDLARELLGNPELRIKEIARRLHFCNEYYFSNFFHQHTGVSPTVFRQHLGHQTEELPASPSER